MVMTFGDAALATLWETGKSKGVRQDLQKRARLALAALAQADHIRHVDPSFRVHPLAGTPRTAMKVSGQWRITFEVRANGTQAADLRLEQYH